MTDAHSVFTTLDDIINELKLTYDSSVGLLDGDSIRTIPNINTLTNLNKLLKNLWNQLDEVESIDSDVLNKIRTIKESEIKSDSKTSENDKNVK